MQANRVGKLTWPSWRPARDRAARQTTATVDDVATARQGASRRGGLALPVVGADLVLGQSLPRGIVRALWRIGLLVIALVVTLTALRLSARGEVFPAVSVLDVPVGGLAEATAEQRVRDRATALLGSPVTFALGDRRWTPLLGELGVTFDVEGSVAAAMAVGRDADRGAGWLRAAHLTQRTYALPLVARLDQATLDAYLVKINDEIGSTPSEVGLTVDGDVVTVTPAREGIALDRTAALQAFVGQLRRPDAMTVALATSRRPPAVTGASAEAAYAVLTRAVAEPLALSYGDQTWRLAPADLARMTLVETVERGGSKEVAVRLDDAALRAFVETIAAEIDVAAVDAEVQETELRKRLVPAVTGRALQLDELVKGVQQAFLAGGHAVPVPVTEANPKVTTEALLADLGITDRLASGDSDFSGSPDGRITNVRHAVDVLDGTLIGPGEWFSFNQSLGDILSDEGFVASGVVEAGISAFSVGGGVCQVSTTVFRAALLAGLPFVERWAHVHRYPYYEQGDWGPGYDASIVQYEGDLLGGFDLKFENPTDDWLLLRMSIKDTLVIAELHGAPTGFEVEISDPEISNQVPSLETYEEVDPNLKPGTAIEASPAKDGMTVVVVRRVFDEDGNELAYDTFVSNYSPKAATYTVSPDMEGTT